MENFKRTKSLIDSVSPSFCAAKWQQVTLHLHNGRTHSCHHPRPHAIPVSEIRIDVSALHNTKFKKDKMSLLKPAFSKTGTITAANASKINDAGCALSLMSEEKVKQTGVKPLARIVNYADAEVEPMDFQLCPTKAAQRALEKAGMKI